MYGFVFIFHSTDPKKKQYLQQIEIQTNDNCKSGTDFMKPDASETQHKTTACKIRIVIRRKKGQ